MIENRSKALKGCGKTPYRCAKRQGPNIPGHLEEPTVGWLMKRRSCFDDAKVALCGVVCVISQVDAAVFAVFGIMQAQYAPRVRRGAGSCRPGLPF